MIRESKMQAGGELPVLGFRRAATALTICLVGGLGITACAESDTVNQSSESTTSGVGGSGGSSASNGSGTLSSTGTQSGSGTGGQGGTSSGTAQGGSSSSTAQGGSSSSTAQGGSSSGTAQGGSGQGGAGQGGAGQGGESQGGAGQGGAGQGGSGQGGNPNCMMPEICNGLDDNCNSMVDEGDPGGGAMCTAPGLGECKKGTEHCVNGAMQCVPAPVAPEVCDGLDNNCEGNTDEGNPGGGLQCMTGFLGLCASGITNCQGMNGVVCTPNVTPGQLPEACNGLDDDCDGMSDEGIPQVGQMCTVGGQLGICQFGVYECPSMPPYQLTCDHPLPGTVPEACNNLDDDCDGAIDDGLNGLPCNTGLPGVCSTGTTQCIGGSSICNPTVSPGSQTEICDAKDNNCNGQTDEMNPTPACASQNPGAQFVTTWGCNMGVCEILQCQIGHANINMAPGDGCECATDSHANMCSNASTTSVPTGGTSSVVGKIESAMSSDWFAFQFVAPPSPGVAYHPQVQLTNNAGGQYAMDVYHDCNTAASCNDNGSGLNSTTWEQVYTYVPTGPYSDNTPKITNVKVRVYRKNGDQATCDQYTVTATNL
jgi:hypothetical protein